MTSRLVEEALRASAPLLTWPERVHDRPHRGRNGRTGGLRQRRCRSRSSTTVTSTQLVHPKSNIVQKMPFDTVEGTGFVFFFPPRRPTSVLSAGPPSPSRHLPWKSWQVWAAPERLWFSGTGSTVVARGQQNARTWRRRSISISTPCGCTPPRHVPAIIANVRYS